MSCSDAVDAISESILVRLTVKKHNMLMKVVTFTSKGLNQRAKTVIV